MLIQLKGGRVIDPVNNRDGVGDVFIENGRIVGNTEGRTPDEVHDVTGKIVMAGAIDVHSHIAGTNVTLGRQLMPELPMLAAEGGQPIVPSPAALGSYATGIRYAEMGYTTVIEPAMIPTHAIEAQTELAAIPIIDTAGLVILGNDDYTLELLRGGRTKSDELKDYVAWTLSHSKAIGLKVINAGGSEAFKFNARTFDLDEEVPDYGVTSRGIVDAMQKAVADLGVPHPPHVHCNNLGIAGNVETAVATLEATQGLPIHFAHIQFYGYGDEGEKGFSSGAARLMEAVNKHKNATVDVGQVMFGQTITVSGDILRQFDGRRAASPKKWALNQGDGNGTGVVPYHYKSKSFVNAMQWAIGLEIFLLAEDPWRVLFSTDHPNGALFVRYPEIMHLLMDKNERARWLDGVPEAARQHSNLAEITRELTLSELAVITRGAPAKLLGLTDRGHLGAGAIADVAVYTEQKNKTKMFSAADLVFKSGNLVVRKGKVVRVTWGRCYHVEPGFDAQIEKRVKAYYDRYFGADPSWFGVTDAITHRPDRFATIPCAS
ncbi:MAG TPA: formylmethanofuran dehydrogenase subunit A [Methyloceanibacter sp.]|nr:formylmethanofuran dehydrogenase subunit A [Methyloceanibacter sp.]